MCICKWLHYITKLLFEINNKYRIWFSETCNSIIITYKILYHFQWHFIMFIYIIIVSVYYLNNYVMRGKSLGSWTRIYEWKYNTLLLDILFVLYILCVSNEHMYVIIYCTSLVCTCAMMHDINDHGAMNHVMCTG